MSEFIQLKNSKPSNDRSGTMLDMKYSMRCFKKRFIFYPKDPSRDNNNNTNLDTNGRGAFLSPMTLLNY